MKIQVDGLISHFFLKTKALKEKLETAIASESSLKKDWLREEEDKAWQDL